MFALMAGYAVLAFVAILLVPQGAEPYDGPDAPVAIA
jgi:hypothetical protein